MDAFWGEQAREQLARWRGDPEAASERVLAERHAWLASEAAGDTLSEAGVQGEVGPEEQGALERHLDAARARMRVAAARDAMRDAWRQPLGVRGHARAAADALQELLRAPSARARAEVAAAFAARADEQATRWLDAIRAQDTAESTTHAGASDLVALAAELLDTTGEAAEETSRWYAGEGARPRFEGLLAGLVAGAPPPLEGKRPWRELAQEFEALGMRGELERNVRLERAHDALLPQVRLCSLSVPDDIRIAPSPIDYGALKVPLAAAGLGRAVALALCSPALRVEARWSPSGGVAEAFGALWMLRWADRAYLATKTHLDARSRHAIKRHAAAVTLLSLRAHAAWACLSDLEAGDARERVGEQLGRALGATVDSGWACTLLRPRARRLAGFRARLGALSLLVALRERYDEDWYRNPRVRELLRGAFMRGPELSVEQWCQELGVELKSGLALVGEL